MSRVKVQSVEERFMFGSPPLLNGFSCGVEHFSCRQQEQPDMQRFHKRRPLLGAFNQLSLSDKHLLLEKTAMPVFTKRKDLRVLQNHLSKERYRQVVMKFGDGGDDKEILATVHQVMKRNNREHVTCLFCAGQSQVYENFPVVDGTLFVSPARLSAVHSLNYDDKYMSYVCVRCLDGDTVSCAKCAVPWHGSFFQIGTLYAYDILSAVPCCNAQFSCTRCRKEILSEDDTHNLYFSYFSKKTVCPHCKLDDHHFVKTLSSFTNNNSQDNI